jgi:hypothetical protein
VGIVRRRPRLGVFPAVQRRPRPPKKSSEAKGRSRVVIGITAIPVPPGLAYLRARLRARVNPKAMRQASMGTSPIDPQSDHVGGWTAGIGKICVL